MPVTVFDSGYPETGLGDAGSSPGSPFDQAWRTRIPPGWVQFPDGSFGPPTGSPPSGPLAPRGGGGVSPYTYNGDVLPPGRTGPGAPGLPGPGQTIDATANPAPIEGLPAPMSASDALGWLARRSALATPLGRAAAIARGIFRPTPAETGELPPRYWPSGAGSGAPGYDPLSSIRPPPIPPQVPNTIPMGMGGRAIPFTGLRSPSGPAAAVTTNLPGLNYGPQGLGPLPARPATGRNVVTTNLPGADYGPRWRPPAATQGPPSGLPYLLQTGGGRAGGVGQSPLTYDPYAIAAMARPFWARA